jgi:UDP-N-acetyl-alpha-D-muramoyl-L-alanyl-L-glutamate epimerase
MAYSEFIFDNYEFEPTANSLSLHYRFPDGPRFTERVIFEFPSLLRSSAAETVLDRIFRLIFLLAGVSYYKAFIPPALRCNAFPIDRATAVFLQSFYENGLAEFAWRNRTSLRGRCQFHCDSGPVPAPLAIDVPRRTCVPVGGGKDSIVTLECLKVAGEPLVLFSLGDAEPIASCMAKSSLPFIRVRRRLDPGLLQLNRDGALNGHVPITGILSAIGLACSVLAGFDTIAMSNEHSASVPNLTLDGIGINHQYSKSLDFERDFANYVASHITPSVAYFSLLRPLSEIAIARRFACHPQYFGDFRSCNTAFRQVPAERGRSWCCDCAKCRFVFLALAPFVAKRELTAVFHRNLLDDESQTEGFAELCGLRDHKPFECVGEVAESAAVMARLGGDPNWRGDAVVRRLHTTYPALARRPADEFEALLAARHPHRVPRAFLTKLYASD